MLVWKERQKPLLRSLLKLLNKYGEGIPEELIAKIKAETEYKALKSWLKDTVKSKSIEEFRSMANI